MEHTHLEAEMVEAVLKASEVYFEFYEFNIDGCLRSHAYKIGSLNAEILTNLSEEVTKLGRNGKVNLRGITIQANNQDLLILFTFEKRKEYKNSPLRLLKTAKNENT